MSLITDDAVDALADAAVAVNGAVENIGARRLQTVLEKLLTVFEQKYYRKFNVVYHIITNFILTVGLINNIRIGYQNGILYK